MSKHGFDVSRTNSDAVISDEIQQFMHSVQTPTSEDIEPGITESLHRVLSETGIDRSKVTHAMLGTTQCTNAIVERKKLAKVGVLRLGYPATSSVLPYTALPEDMVGFLSVKYKLTGGGYEYD
ncbi:hydantoinase/oxoprolinase N-terminal domain-containing protein, partial [Listeria monocytogenes]|uniref:hydantoinase/oxoprolinase N-terminal domain-containing protein n=1 Tax=Listeria monocytogenes TaxID=1639 RepID=UPI0024429CDF